MLQKKKSLDEVQKEMQLEHLTYVEFIEHLTGISFEDFINEFAKELGEHYAAQERLKPENN